MPRYTTVGTEGGWIILENDRPIAFAEQEVYARAIIQALNSQRAMIGWFADRISRVRASALN